MSRLPIILLAALGGGLIAAQAPINARLRVAVGAPLLSAAISFAVGTVLLCAAVAATTGPGGLRDVGSAPWWAWLGGLCGAVLVAATLVSVPRIGVTATFVAVILGQVLVATVIDRVGAFGVTVRHLTPERIGALGLLGVALVLLTRR